MEAAERASWQRRLSDWHETSDFGQLVSECHRAFGEFGTLIEHGSGFWRDAWIAHQFAILTKADAVRLLHPRPFPDFAIKRNGAEQWFEATEAMRVGRRRGDEFRRARDLWSVGKKHVEPDPADKWLTPTLAHKMLERSASKKACKPYASDCGLVIYLNESHYGDHPLEIPDTFADATIAATAVFRSVHVLWEDQIYAV